jgi:hypothetical protein
VSACPGCGLVLDEVDGPTHPYLGASAACWALYGQLLAREFGSLRYPPWHRLTVDAYAVQHPGVLERRSIQSVGVHLISLCLVLERGTDGEAAMALLARTRARRPDLQWLDPPVPNGTVTVVDVLEAADAEAAVRRWADDVWSAWSPHHAVVRAWLAESLA